MMKLGKLITVYDATRLHSVSFHKLLLQMDLAIFDLNFYQSAEPEYLTSIQSNS